MIRISGINNDLCKGGSNVKSIEINNKRKPCSSFHATVHQTLDITIRGQRIYFGLVYSRFVVYKHLENFLFALKL